MSIAQKVATLGPFLNQVEKDKESVYKMDIGWWIKGKLSQWNSRNLFHRLKSAH